MGWEQVLLKHAAYREAIDVKAMREASLLRGVKHRVEGPLSLDMFYFLLAEGVIFYVTTPQPGAQP